MNIMLYEKALHGLKNLNTNFSQTLYAVYAKLCTVKQV